MNKIRYILGTVAMGVLLLTSFVAHTSTASASTPYDNNYTMVDSLFYGDESYYGINCAVEDVSDNYIGLFEDADNWASSSMYGLFSSFDDAVEDGSWSIGVVQNHTASGGNHYQVALTWNPNGGDIIFDGNSVTTWNAGDITATLSMRQSQLGYGGCVPYIIAYDVSAAVSTYPGVSDSNTASGTYSSNYFATNWDVTYPSGVYEGAYIRTSAPTPPTAPIAGTVDCGDENPSLMTIAQAGNNGAATLTYVSLGISEWSYDLRTDVPYSFNVLCGTKLAAPFGAVSATSSSNLWTCDVYGPEPWYCVLS